MRSARCAVGHPCSAGRRSTRLAAGAPASTRPLVACARRHGVPSSDRLRSSPGGLVIARRLSGLTVTAQSTSLPLYLGQSPTLVGPSQARRPVPPSCGASDETITADAGSGADGSASGPRRRPVARKSTRVPRADRALRASRAPARRGRARSRFRGRCARSRAPNARVRTLTVPVASRRAADPHPRRPGPGGARRRRRRRCVPGRAAGRRRGAPWPAHPMLRRALSAAWAFAKTSSPSAGVHRARGRRAGTRPRAASAPACPRAASGSRA